MGAFTLGTMYWLDPNLGRARIDEELRRVRDNEFRMIRVFVWWEALEAEEGRFDFGRHDDLYECAEKHGLSVMESFGLYAPPWLRARLLDAGIDDEARRYPCFDRPEVSVPMRRFVEAVVERYRRAPALAVWNLWNEPTQPACRCPHTLAKFAAWLRRAYPDAYALRRAWLGEHQVFATLRPPEPEALTAEWLAWAFRLGTRGRVTPMEYDFLHFAADNLADNLARLRDTVRRLDPVHPTHANPSSPHANGYSIGLDEWKAARVLDNVGVSVHPSHFFFALGSEDRFPGMFAFCADQIRCQAAGKDAWVGELQAGTTFFHANRHTPAPEDIAHDLWQAAGRGLRGVLFWTWRSWRSSMMEVGEFGLRRAHDGGPTERSEAAARVGRILRENEEVFRGARPRPARAAILSSMASRAYKLLQGQAKPHIPHLANEAHHAAFGYYEALDRENFAVDFVTETQLAEGILSRYAALFLPHTEIMDKDTAAAVMAFARAGGHVWADGRCAFLDEHVFLRSMIPGHGLDELFGAREADFTAVRPGEETIRTTGGGALRAFRHVQYLDPTTAETRGLHRGRPVWVRNRYGSGAAELCGTYLGLGLKHEPTEENRRLLTDFARAAGLRPKLSVRPLPEVGACFLEGDDVDIVLLFNRSNRRLDARAQAPAAYARIDCPTGQAVDADAEGLAVPLAPRDTACLICRKA